MPGGESAGFLHDDVPYLKIGQGPPLVVVAGLTPDHDVPKGWERRIAVTLRAPAGAGLHRLRRQPEAGTQGRRVDVRHRRAPGQRDRARHRPAGVPAGHQHRGIGRAAAGRGPPRAGAAAGAGLRRLPARAGRAGAAGRDGAADPGRAATGGMGVRDHRHAPAGAARSRPPAFPAGGGPADTR